MDVHSILNDQLPTGVAICYERDDAEYLVHLLGFLEEYKKQHKGKFVLIPSIMSGKTVYDAVRLRKEFDKFPKGGRIINGGEITVSFFDEMRPLFSEYVASLKHIQTEAETKFEWDGDHPFFYPLQFFIAASETYFPEKFRMH